MTHLTPSHFGLPADRFPEFRPMQYELGSRLSESTTRFTLLQSPVGSGKSFIYMFASLLRESRTLILAPNKGLQRQIDDSFPGLVFNIYGHSHYPCSSRTRDTNNPDPNAFDFECEDWNSCIYRGLVDECNSHNIALSNPAHWINTYLIGEPGRLGKFDSLIIDEAHDLHTQIVSAIAFNPLSMIHGLFTLRTPDDTANIHSWASWCSESISKAQYVSSNIRGRKDKRSKTVIAKCDRLMSRFGLFLASIDGGDRWISIPDERNSRYITLSPVWAYPFAESIVFRGIPNVILTSGTLPEIPTVTRLGISRDNYTYIDNPSQFDPKRSPFIFAPSAQVKYGMSAGESRLHLSVIDSIMDETIPSGKGLIQSQSYDRTEALMTQSRHRQYLHSHKRADSADFAEELQSFLAATAPYVFVSPRAKEGLDLRGDKCRWQIFAKVPFLSLVDPLTKARSEESAGYAFTELATSMEQMDGRSRRDEIDWAAVFMIDNQWKWVRETCVCGHGRKDHVMNKIHACTNKKCGCVQFQSIFSKSFLKRVIMTDSTQEAIRIYRTLRKSIGVL